MEQMAWRNYQENGYQTRFVIYFIKFLISRSFLYYKNIREICEKLQMYAAMFALRDVKLQ